MNDFLSCRVSQMVLIGGGTISKNYMKMTKSTFLGQISGGGGGGQWGDKPIFQVVGRGALGETLSCTTFYCQNRPFPAETAVTPAASQTKFFKMLRMRQTELFPPELPIKFVWSKFYPLDSPQL